MLAQVPDPCRREHKLVTRLTACLHSPLLCHCNSPRGPARARKRPRELAAYGPLVRPRSVCELSAYARMRVHCEGLREASRGCQKARLPGFEILRLRGREGSEGKPARPRGREAARPRGREAAWLSSSRTESRERIPRRREPRYLNSPAAKTRAEGRGHRWRIERKPKKDACSDAARRDCGGLSGITSSRYMKKDACSEAPPHPPLSWKPLDGPHPIQPGRPAGRRPPGGPRSEPAARSVRRGGAGRGHPRGRGGRWRRQVARGGLQVHR
jgi:hypothetical protein